MKHEECAAGYVEDEHQLFPRFKIKIVAFLGNCRVFRNLSKALRKTQGVAKFT